MTDTKRDVLDGLEGMTPGPWHWRHRSDDHPSPHGYPVHAEIGASPHCAPDEGDHIANVFRDADALGVSMLPQLVKEIRRLRKALEHMVCNCIACEGLGELREAVQAWDVPRAPVPECGVCRDARALLPETEPSDEP